MGRNKEPVKLIQAKGKSHHLTKEKAAERESLEVHAGTDRIEPPKFLSAKEKKEFMRIAEELNRIGIMSNLDCDVLGRYVRSQSDWTAYGKLVAKTLKVLEKAVGTMDEEASEKYTGYLSKYEGLRTKAFNQCQTCASSLGLTITSRCRIVVPKKDDTPKENKFSEYIS